MIAVVFLAVYLAGLSACSGTYGRLAVNPDVKTLFQRYEVLPDHQYFYTVLPTRPRVIIGLHKDYTLQSDFWHPVEATPERLKRWLDWQQDYKQILMGQNGSDIFDKNGRRIGVWYALINDRDWGKVQMIDLRTVNIILQETPVYPWILKFRHP